MIPLLAAIVFLSSLPDAAVAPLLRDLLVERYGVSESAAHVFMIVNILGALAALLWLRRRGTAPCSPRTTIATAAAINGLLLLIMSLPIGFAATVGVRIAEGAADLIVFAGLFEMLRQSGCATRCGSRLGIGATMLMLGLAAGMALSGPLGAAGGGAAFVAGGCACWIAAVLALRLPGRGSGASGADAHRLETAVIARGCRLALWPVWLMAGSDRALGAMLAVSVPMHVAGSASMPRSTMGAAIAVAMMLMASGAWAGGAMADRFDAARSRALAAGVYGFTFLLLPFAIEASAMFVLAMVAVGMSGAVLLPSMLSLAARSGCGAAAMGATQAAGNIGFAVGILFAAGVLQLASSEADRAPAYELMLHGAGLCYLVINVVAAVAVKGPVATSQVLPRASEPATVKLEV